METLTFIHKRVFFSLLFLFLLAEGSFANNGEIAFFQGTWEQALTEAGKQNKPVFIDAYATWCGPCKYMDKNVFNNADVATYFNDKFISYKLDVDKEVEIAQKYEITAMPTYLFLEANGEVMYRQTGAMEPKDFIKVAQTALELPELEKQYQAGERSPEFMVKYLLLNADSENENMQKIADEFLATVDESILLSEDGLKLMTAYIYDPDSKAFQFYLKNYATYSEKYGDLAAEVAYNITYTYLEDIIRTAVAEKDASQIAKFEEFILKLDPAIPTIQAEEIVSLTYIQFYQMLENLEQDWPKYAPIVLKHFDKFGSFNQDLTISSGYNFSVYVEDKAQLEKMLTHLQEVSPANEVNGMMLKFIQARLLAKLERKEEALPLAKEALEMADQAGYGKGFIQEFISELESE